jgi:hypothetical protein
MGLNSLDVSGGECSGQIVGDGLWKIYIDRQFLEGLRVKVSRMVEKFEG